MKYYTDYPINGVDGVKEVEVLAYDRNKYVTVLFQGKTTAIKAGYLMQDEALTKPVLRRQLLALPAEEGGSVPSRREIHAELKQMRRQHRTSYTLLVGDEAHEYRSLKESLAHFGRVYRDADCTLIRYRARKYRWGSEPFVASEGGQLIILLDSGAPYFKAHHRRLANL